MERERVSCQSKAHMDDKKPTTVGICNNTPEDLCWANHDFGSNKYWERTVSVLTRSFIDEKMSL